MSGAPELFIGRTHPRDGRDWDNQCARCGSSVTHDACEACGGQGFSFGDDDEGYSETMACEVCNGEGGWLTCLSSPEWCNANPRNHPERRRGEIEWCTFDPAHPSTEREP